MQNVATHIIPYSRFNTDTFRYPQLMDLLMWPLIMSLAVRYCASLHYEEESATKFCRWIKPQSLRVKCVQDTFNRARSLIRSDHCCRNISKICDPQSRFSFSCLCFVQLHITQMMLLPSQLQSGPITNVIVSSLPANPLGAAALLLFSALP